MSAGPNPFLVPAIAASQFATPFMISGVAVGLPALGEDLGAGATALSLVETLYLAAATALLLPFGRLGDAADKATLYKAGLAGFALSSILCGLVSSTPLLLALRFLQGMCSAAVQAIAPALIADAVPPERRGRAFGLMVGAVYAGLTLGPLAAGWLVELWGWRSLFLVGGAVVAAVLGAIHLLLAARWRRPAPGAVHLPSALLVVAAMLAMVGGASTLGDHRLLGAAGLAASLALLVAFLRLQRGLAQPLLNVEVLMKNTLLRNALVAQVLIYCNGFGSVFLLSLHMQAVLGASAETAGRVFAIGTLAMALLAPAAGALADRVRAHLLAAWGLGFALAAGLAMTQLDEHSSLALVAVMFSVQGVGFAFFSSPNTAIVMNAVPANRTGIAGALSAGARAFGMAAGMIAVGAIVSVNLGHDAVGAAPARLVDTLQAGMWVLAVLTALGLAIALRGMKTA